jgi:hypothetical protein
MNTRLHVEPPPPGQRLAAIVPARLAAPITPGAPSWPPDEAHHHVHNQAMGWQVMAGDAQLWEMGPAEENRAYELIGQMGSVGEQLALALAAAGEVAAWRECRQQADAEHEMCMRAVAEAQCLFVIGTGQALANVALRALALDSKLRAELIRRFSTPNASPTFAVFSEQREDWVSMNRDTCKTLRKVAKSSESPKVVRLIEPVVTVGKGQSWNAAVDRRGEEFHRWRPQTHGIEGVPRKTQWTQDGDSRVLHIGRLSYDEARGRADETALIATAAMLDLAVAMEGFKAELYRASRRLGGPKFVTKDSELA